MSRPGRRWARGPIFALGLAGVAAVLLAACPAVRPSRRGCATDAECKGDRLCRVGACIDPGALPATAAGGTAPAAAADGQPSRPPFSMFKGDAAHAGRAGGAAPERTPTEVWRFQAGGPVVGSPSVG